MLEKLQNSERFKKELDTYKQSIEKIVDERVKLRAKTILDELIAQIRLIDEGHNSRNNGYINPQRVRDNVQRTVELRRELNQYVKDSK